MGWQILLLFSLFSLIFTPLAMTAPFVAWPVDPLEKVFTDAKPSEVTSGVINLRSARGEYESGEVVVLASERISTLRASVTELKQVNGATISAGNVRVRFVGFIPIKKNSPSVSPEQLIRRAPCEIPDVLLDDETISLEPNRAQPVWLTVYVPDDASPGKYEGALVLAGGGSEQTIPIQLEVLPFAIPKERHLQVTNWINWGNIARHHKVKVWSDEYWKLLEIYAADWREHRQNVVMVDVGLIDCYLTEDGQLECDYKRFDRLVELLERAGVLDRLEIPFMAQHGSKGWSDPEIHLRTISAVSRKTGERVRLSPEKGLKPFLQNLQAHLAQRGWLKKAIMHVCDEPAAHNIESWRKASRFIHEAAPKIARIDAIETTGFGDDLEVWVPKLNHLRNWFDHYREMQRRGKELWFYTCCHPWGYFPNRFLDKPLVETRILHWMNWYAGATGYLHWGLVAWTDDPFHDAGEPRLPPGDRCIIYPGKEGPLDSIRWEQMRDGIEDYEYLWLLRERMQQVQNQLGAAAQEMDATEASNAICARLVRSFTDYAEHAAELNAARHQLQDEIVQATQSPLVMLKLEPPSGTELLAGPIAVIVRGVVEKGAEVMVNGARVYVDGQGRFVRQFSPGKGQVVVEVKGKAGSKRITREYRVR